MKKVFIIATVILVFLFIFVLVLTRKKTSQTQNQPSTVIPTTVPLLEESGLNQLKASSPVETDDFTLTYQPETDKFVVNIKTSQGRDQFTEWAYNNQAPELVENANLVEFHDQKADSYGSLTNQKTDPVKILNNFIDALLSYGQGIKLPSSSAPIPGSSSLTGNGSSFGNIYYSQCNGYGSTPLPSGCALCNAGCGPTTVAMIASSYLNSSYNPQAVVDMYRSKGYLLSCDGSRYTDAKSVLESLGLQTTSYIVLNFEKADQVVSELRNYLDAGWTFFVLANFKQSGGGHYFWVTDIDNEGNIWAYDPYYGRGVAPPINENSRYPFPLYRIAFGVKK